MPLRLDYGRIWPREQLVIVKLSNVKGKWRWGGLRDMIILSGCGFLPFHFLIY